MMIFKEERRKCQFHLFVLMIMHDPWSNLYQDGLWNIPCDGLIAVNDAAAKKSDSEVCI